MRTRAHKDADIELRSVISPNRKRAVRAGDPDVTFSSRLEERADPPRHVLRCRRQRNDMSGMQGYNSSCLARSEGFPKGKLPVYTPLLSICRSPAVDEPDNCGSAEIRIREEHISFETRLSRASLAPLSLSPRPASTHSGRRLACSRGFVNQGKPWRFA